jgi:hypothetical protein
MPLPPPLKPLTCSNPDCTLPDGGRCARLAEFPDPLAECVDLLREKPVDVEVPSEGAAPWSGRHLDRMETDALLWNSPARLITVLGASNAGKTCFLTSFFLQLANGQNDGFSYRVASSRTLHGFRELMERAEQWSGQAEDGIVPHTVVGQEGASQRSFLHLGLRPSDASDDRHIDFLLSDIPGEWVKNWSSHLDDVTRRQMAFVQRSDGFIILADAGALLGSKGPRVDADTSLLVRRVVDFSKALEPRPPLALVLSKFDQVVEAVLPPEPEQRGNKAAWGPLGGRLVRTWGALEAARAEGIPVGVFPVSAFPNRMAEGQPVGVMAPFNFMMAHADRREPWAPIELPIPAEARGFDTLRRWRETT